MSRLSWLPFGRVPEIDAARLHELLTDGGAPQIVDVRTAVEYHSGHIRGAIHAPIFTLQSQLPHLALDRTRPVIAICATAHRSIPAVRWLRRQGFEAYQLKGGMITWNRLRLPTVKESI